MVTSYQVWAWGDNDHGQQGNGTTCVNRRPATVSLACGVQRAAAGSSHSVAWSLPPAAPPDAVIAPLPFPVLRDPLGAYALGKHWTTIVLCSYYKLQK